MKMVSVAEFDVSNDSWLATGLLNSTQNLAGRVGFEPTYLPVMSRVLIPYELENQNLAEEVGIEPTRLYFKPTD